MSSTGFGCGQSDESPSLPLPNWPSRAVGLWTLRHDPDTKLAGGSAKFENQVRFHDVSVIEEDPDVMNNSASVN
jgi:hypothetical protein